MQMHYHRSLTRNSAADRVRDALPYWVQNLADKTGTICEAHAIVHPEVRKWWQKICEADALAYCQHNVVEKTGA